MTQQATQITSKIFTLQLRDLAKGFLVAALSPVFIVVMGILQTGSLEFDWKAIGTTALASGLGYLAKNFFEPTQTVIVTDPPIEPENGKKDVMVQVTKVKNTNVE